MGVEQSGQGVIHSIGVTALGKRWVRSWLRAAFASRYSAADIVSLPPAGRLFTRRMSRPVSSALPPAGALAVVDIAQRPEQDAFVGTVEFNFTFQFFLQCQLYIGKRLRFALKAIQLKKFQK